MNDYIKEFGDDQKKRILPVNFQPQDDWDFEHPIKYNSKEEPKKDFSGDEDDHISFATESDQTYNRPVTYFDPKTKKNRPAQWITKQPMVQSPQTGISQNELKEIVSDAVLHMMNAPISDNSLLESQKQEIEKIISEYWNRAGIMSICFHEDLDKDEASVGMLIDPTNTQNWVFLKEEIIYKLPYAFKESLHSFASEVWKKKDLVLEVEANPSEQFLRDLKQQVDGANKEADARYNEVATHSTHYMSSNPFERFSSSTPNPQEGHRMALADGQYRALKKKAIDLEAKYRKLLKHIKKSNF